MKKFLKLSGLLSVSLQFILQACNPADKKFTCCQTSGFPKMRTFGFPKWFSQQAIFLLLLSFTILWVCSETPPDCDSIFTWGRRQSEACCLLSTPRCLDSPRVIKSHHPWQYMSHHKCKKLQRISARLTWPKKKEEKHCQRHNGPRNWLRDLD